MLIQKLLKGKEYIVQINKLMRAFYAHRYAGVKTYPPIENFECLKPDWAKRFLCPSNRPTIVNNLIRTYNKVKKDPEAALKSGKFVSDQESKRLEIQTLKDIEGRILNLFY